MSLPLTELASSIQNQVPRLLEGTLRHKAESNALENQCAELKACIEGVKARITKEREEQGVLRDKIIAVRACRESQLSFNPGRSPSTPLGISRPFCDR